MMGTLCYRQLLAFLGFHGSIAAWAWMAPRFVALADRTNAKNPAIERTN